MTGETTGPGTPRQADVSPRHEEQRAEPDFRVTPRGNEARYRVVQDCSGAVEYEAGADFSEFYG